MKITVIDNTSQEIHVHAPECRDIARSTKKLATYGPPQVTDYDGHQEAAEDFFGDVAADEHDYGSEEWEEAVVLEWEICAHIHPCARA